MQYCLERQVTIAKSILDGLGLVPGSILDFVEEDGKIVARKVISENPISEWRGRGRLPVGKSVSEYLQIIRGAE